LISLSALSGPVWYFISNLSVVEKQDCNLNSWQSGWIILVLQIINVFQSMTSRIVHFQNIITIVGLMTEPNSICFHMLRRSSKRFFRETCIIIQQRNIHYHYMWILYYTIPKTGVGLHSPTEESREVKVSISLSFYGLAVKTGSLALQKQNYSETKRIQRSVTSDNFHSGETCRPWYM